ncbi:uncharacterized protein LOC130414310 [Triplophysa dalaica]|uniref:uncharacterized protein LOC130414310 n=1 Tax=Triplophysa dalaica TaxID=1582913 RepID=UPI0024DFABB4|nr:uncharacterized protein LOC130414310 [Triplophysa dalaica]
MKLIQIRSKWLLVCIIGYHVTSGRFEVSSHEHLRILILGDKHDVRRSADVLLGRKATPQIVKGEVISNESDRKMMLIFGPNPCEKNTETQDFKTALFFSSPGPHAVLLTLKDEECEECDVLKHVQERLGSEVLQYCILLLSQENADSMTRRAEETIHACGGRVLKITRAKPLQTKALMTHIQKLITFNRESFYSPPKTFQDPEKRREGLNLTLEETAVIVFCSLVCLSLTVLVIYTQECLKYFTWMSGFVLLVSLRRFLSPDVAIPLNMALFSSTVSALAINNEPIREGITLLLLFVILPPQNKYNLLKSISFVIMLLLFKYLVCLLGLGLIFGAASIRSWSDVLTVCYAARGVIVCNILCSFYILKHFYVIRDHAAVVVPLSLFLSCMMGAILSIEFVKAFPLTDKIINILFIFICTYFYFKW